MSVRGVVRDVSVRLGTVQALDEVSLSVEPGQFLALLGPSGSGKTTTLNVLAGFVRPDRGEVTFDGRDMTSVPANRRDIGIVFQGYALFPHMSVADNVAFPLRMRRVDRAERARRVRDALELVGLGEHAARDVATLSGGQRQRVALARAVVFEPRMLLLDEPLAALDKQLRESMQLELRRLQQRVGITTVAVTHDQVEALTMADVVAVMRDGRIEQIAPPDELYLRPASRFVATFLGEANVIPVADGELRGFGRLPGTGTAGHAVIRPEQISLTADGGPLSARARIEELTFQGSRARVRARVENVQDVVLTIAVVQRPGDPPVVPGDAAVLSVSPDAVHLLPD